MNKTQPPEMKAHYSRMLRQKRKSLLSEVDTSHIWAVSYADVLMVLLSFFIMYFNLTNENELQNDVLAQVTTAFKGGFPTETLRPIRLSQEVTNQAETKVQTNQLMHVLLKNLTDQSIETELDPLKQSVVVHFSENIYNNLAFNVNSVVKEELIKALKILEPYKESIYITFIGHTDSKKIISKNELTESILTNNINLASVRASKAAEFAIQFGFLPEKVGASSYANYKRNTRSVSLMITVHSVETQVQKNYNHEKN